MTNGDKIRAMTDKELATFVAGEVLRLDGVRLEVATEAWCWKFQQEAKDGKKK